MGALGADIVRLKPNIANPSLLSALFMCKSSLAFSPAFCPSPPVPTSRSLPAEATRSTEVTVEAALRNLAIPAAAALAADPVRLNPPSLSSVGGDGTRGFALSTDSFRFAGAPVAPGEGTVGADIALEKVAVAPALALLGAMRC